MSPGVGKARGIHRICRACSHARNVRIWAEQKAKADA